jgi:hypothetical protein
MSEKLSGSHMPSLQVSTDANKSSGRQQGSNIRKSQMVSNRSSVSVSRSMRSGLTSTRRSRVVAGSDNVTNKVIVYDDDGNDVTPQPLISTKAHGTLAGNLPLQLSLTVC